MKLSVTVVFISFAVAGVMCRNWCNRPCNNKADVPVCVCQANGIGHGGCIWLSSHCEWENCYSDTLLLMPNSQCDKDTKLDTRINEDAVPPHGNNGRGGI